MRDTLALLALLPLLVSSLFAGDPPADPARVYRVRQTVQLDQIPAGAKLVRWWISVPDDAPAQRVLDFAVSASPGPWRLERDPERGNRFLYVEVADPQASEL